MQPLMPKATAVWLVDNTTLTFNQIAEFVGLHPLEISGIADGEVAQGIKGFDPISNNQLTREEIERCEKNPEKRLRMVKPVSAPPVKKKAPRYTPLSKRQDRPAAIAWLVRNHPELADSQISKLLGTTKQTIAAIRDKRHWNSQNIQPVDPVALGLCTQIALDAAVKIAAEKAAAAGKEFGPPEGAGLMSTEESLGGADADPLHGFAEIAQSAVAGDHDGDGREAAMEPVGWADADAPSERPADDGPVDPDALFNLAREAPSEEEEDERR